MNDIVTVENLTFTYGGPPVLDGLSLEVRQGELVCLLGPNGVGKTTLIENLLGSLAPQSGTVRVLGTDPRRAPASFWTRIGLVQQNWTDHPKWRVADQLEWIRSIQMTATDDVSTVEDVLTAVGLSEQAGSRLSRLSGGQRRSVDLAAALLGRPSLLVLDEPTTGLDPVARTHVHDLIAQRIDDGATVLMTTHDLAEAERLASRVLIMAHGRVLADGSVTELREQLSDDAEITWVQDGRRHVHTTPTPERFLQSLDLGSISELTVTRPTLEETYLALTRKETRS
ncbi:ABC transporter ATP-binding protein [Actinomyces sp. W5033]|uniref:ABC transporter ATP-binding protein n=1 Tax=Actinomyces sp. W5033 TaxID=3446479 RepID=UPI003EE2E908